MDNQESEVGKHQNEEMMANLMWKMATNLSRKNGEKKCFGKFI